MNHLSPEERMRSLGGEEEIISPNTGNGQLRSYPRAESRPDAPAPAFTKPQIVVAPGRIDKLSTKGEAAVAESGLPVFQRDRKLVRPFQREALASGGRVIMAAGLQEINGTSMIDILNQAACWVRMDNRSMQYKPCDPPKSVADIILTRAGQWTVAPLAGIITAPTLRPDGSIITKPGYDQETRLFHVEDRSLRLPPLNDTPSRSDALDALASLDELLRNFPFISDVDRSVALSAILTTVARGGLGVVPMHGFRAFMAGSGKSFLVDLISTISTGRPCPVTCVSEKPEETEKRIIGLLLSGFPLISLDNVNGELGSDTLCQAIERPLLSLRALGRSDMIEIENRVTIFATGNNLRVRGDMTRRTLLCSLDAQVERPELRRFDFDPIESVIADRGRYVAASLTILRAYLAANYPIKLPTIASFGEWSRLIRGALVWLEREDPAKSVEAVRQDDPELGQTREVLELWREHLALDHRYRVSGLIETAESRSLDPDNGRPGSDYRIPELREAFLRVAGERGVINAEKLGKWLRDHKGSIVDGVCLDSEGAGKKPAKWVLRSIRAPAQIT